MEWIGFLVLVLVVVLLTERLATGSMRHRSPDGGETAGSGAFGELVEIFQPSRTHVTAERERQRLDIVQRPAEGHPFGVDLDGGVAYLGALPPSSAPSLVAPPVSSPPTSPVTASSTAVENPSPSAGEWIPPSIVHSSTRTSPAQPE